MIHEYISAKIATFTVDTTGPLYVPIVSVNNIMKTAYGYYKIQAKDNILIKKMAIALPYDFCLADERLSISTFYRNVTAGINYEISEIGVFGILWFFSENLDVDLDVLWQWKANLLVNTYTYFGSQAAAQIDQDGTFPPAIFPRISMINVPAALNTIVLPVYAFMEIQHTIALGI